MATQPRPEMAPMPPERPAGVGATMPSGATNAQWGAITAGTLAGYAAFLILATLGLAIGVTAAPEPGIGAQEIGIGAGVWWLITLVATGIFGGWVIGRTSRSDRPYMPFIFGTVAWALGAVILMVLLWIGLGNLLGGIGGAVGQAFAQQPMPTGVMEGLQVQPIATSTAWILFGSMLVGWLATVGGAYLGSPLRHGEHVERGGRRLEAR